MLDSKMGFETQNKGEMAMGKTKVVVADSGITAPQMQDFWRKVGDGTIDGRNFQKYLENPWRFSEGEMTVVRAANILGQGKVFVVTAEQAVKNKQLEMTPASAPIRYNEASVRECARQNKNGEDWRLVYCHGYSWRELCEKFGEAQDNHPGFSEEYTRKLNSSEEFWATINQPAGYYLINLRGQFDRKSHTEQTEEIAKLGKEYERCHEAIFSEAILTISIINNGERIAKDWYHWGILQHLDGWVCVGKFDNCVRVFNIMYYDDSVFPRVVVVRKFDY